MDENEKPAVPTRAEVMKRIEENRVIIERSERLCAEMPRVILEEERRRRRLLQIIRQLGRT